MSSLISGIMDEFTVFTPVKSIPLAKVNRFLLFLFLASFSTSVDSRSSKMLHVQTLPQCNVQIQSNLRFSMMSWMQSEVVQGLSYLIYKGSFGCRARRHVGLIQVESPRAETTVHIWSDFNQMWTWKWKQEHSQYRSNMLLQTSFQNHTQACFYS